MGKWCIMFMYIAPGSCFPDGVVRFRAGCGGGGGGGVVLGGCNATASVADGDFGWIAIPGADVDEARSE